MYCPEHIIVNNKHVILTMYGSADIRKELVPMRWWINPLRYSVVIRRPNRMHINPEGRWNLHASNFFYTWVTKPLRKLKQLGSGKGE